MDRVEYDRQYYQRNKAKRQAQNKAWREALTAEVREYKASKPCTDCDSFFHPVAMQFDHLGDKTDAVANLIRKGNTKQVWDEIQKCDLVCANCHAVRTYTRQQGVGKPG